MATTGLGGGADSAYHFETLVRANFDQFWNNILNDTRKKAQNPNDEVCSLETDDMAKDWKNIEKTRNRNIFKNWEMCAVQMVIPTVRVL